MASGIIESIMTKFTQYTVADVAHARTTTGNDARWLHAATRPPLAPPSRLPTAGDAERDVDPLRRYGISAETKLVYGYEGHVYERLDDAVTYAQIQASRRSGPTPADPTGNR